jgi:hypothetical protein
MMNYQQNLFLNEQDICKVAWKLAKKMYKKHENDTQIVRMRVVENKDNIFFYQEINAEVDNGGSQRRNMPFTIGIQTSWQ